MNIFQWLSDKDDNVFNRFLASHNCFVSIGIGFHRDKE